MNDPLFFQLFELETSTYTYLLVDRDKKAALIIDSVLETVERDLQLIRELGVDLKWILETHIHADHITGAATLRQKTGAKVGLAAVAGASGADLLLQDGQTVGEGVVELRVLSTPGHTDSCLSYYRPGRVFTGDALMIHAAGRTDFQQGSAERLYDSIHKKLFTLPDDTFVYPGHDYKGFTSSTIGLEKRFNPRVGGGRSREEFVRLMSELKLSPPRRMDVAVPANLRLGEVR